ncbi:hypothetical protein H0266_03555 [Halobacillus locisalis]|uniref:YusW-like protein n=1 Tax=Halobacillus locisalis TaxID=220753 RepID=A0A838CPP5_9BACI|nr:hypothetical protein [Halobacillus locisalis]
MRYRGILMILIISVVGCTANNQQEQPEDLVVTPTSYDVREKSDPLFEYERFNLLVDYEDELQYEVNFDQQLKVAQIKELKDQNVIGKEAFNQLSPHLMEMSFDEDTPEHEVIREVLEILGLKETFQEVVLDVKFENGIEKLYNQ